MEALCRSSKRTSNRQLTQIASAVKCWARVIFKREASVFKLSFNCGRSLATCSLCDCRQVCLRKKARKLSYALCAARRFLTPATVFPSSAYGEASLANCSPTFWHSSSVIAFSFWSASMSDQFRLASRGLGIQRFWRIRYGPLRSERDLLRRPLDQTFGLRHTRPFRRDKGFEYGLCFPQLRPETDA
jgi:hypothetical protein